jgi:hypothetical protein
MTASASARRPFRWRRWLALTALVVLLLIGLFLGGSYWMVTSSADRNLREAEEQADQLDPGWRWEELEAKRGLIPDDRNSALRVLATRRLLPGTDWASLATDKKLDVGDITPEVQLTAKQTEDLRGELEKLAAARAEARRLRDLPAGRYPLVVSSDYISTKPDQVQFARAAAWLLQLDAALLAQDGQADEALDSGRALVNAGRSVAGEPMLICMLTHIGCQRLGLLSIERTLAQGEPSEPALRAAQELVQREADAVQPLLLATIRGERAGIHRCLEAVARGELTGRKLQAELGTAFHDQVEDWLGEWSAHQSHGPLLRVLSEYVEIARLPLDQQADRYAQVDATGVGAVGNQLLFDVSKAHAAARRSQALCRCMVATLAVERYRRAHGHWPSTLGDLCPAYLAAVPDDPFGQGTLCYRRLDDGVVIYSLGVSGTDHGGRLDRKKWNAPESNMGFRLWDVDKRRQLPPAPKP